MVTFIGCEKNSECEAKKEITAFTLLKLSVDGAAMSGGKTLKGLLPYQKIGSYLSEIEAKTILRKLRHEEYIAKQADQKIKFGRLMRLLEEEWGLRGKY